MIIRPAGLVRHQNQLLTMRYRYGEHDRFNLPGGNLEAGESAPACLQREFREELALRIEVEDLLFCAETIVGERHTVHLIFPVTVLEGSPCLQPGATRAIEICWLPFNIVAQSSLYPNISAPLTHWLLQHSVRERYLGTLSQEWF
ncbi:NUDIX domain-containing protein [Candidatus Magnetaquicoccus inordinatus]|uniref:NUDIX domain-containing protein n=1 Tax=Candidatus Magnetaquicoccus inordinatus TaxID=2496818 RepID=UPI00102AE73D|nr:NUDIX domain-containing protein [Candidatus Magnetaquicoccus inordinatus]